MKLIVDESICTGCRCCELACSAGHENVFVPSRSRVRITSSREQHGSAITVCTQCPEEFCAQACSSRAITRDAPDGVVTIDYDLCTQCLSCIDACPYGAMLLDPQTDLPIKCDLCGGVPECVQFCRSKALTFAA